MAIIFPIAYKVDTSALKGAEGVMAGFAAKLKAAINPINLMKSAVTGLWHEAHKSVQVFETYAGSVRQIQRLTGGTVADASRLTGAFKLMGMQLGGGGGDNAANVNGAMQRFAKNLGQAANNSKAAAKLTSAFGTSVVDAHGKVKPMAELLPKLADHFKAMPDGAEKSALAMQLFGRAGAQMLPFLNQGASGIAELEKKAQSMGLVLNDTAINNFKEAKKATREWHAAIQGLQVTIGSSLLPVFHAVQATVYNALTPAMQGFVGFLQGHQQTFQNFAATLTGMGKGLDGFKGGLDTITKSITNWISGGGITKIIQQFAELRSKIVTALAQALPEILNALITAVGAALPGIIQALVAMIPQILTTAQTVFRSLIQAVQTVVPVLISTIVAMLPQIIQSAIALFSGIMSALTVMIPEIINLVADLVPMIIDQLVSLLPALIAGAIQLFVGLVTALGTVLPQIINMLTDVVLPKLLDTVIKSLPLLLNASVTLFSALIQAIPKILPPLITAVLGMIPVITGVLIKSIPQLISAGAQLLMGLVKGMLQNAPQILTSLGKTIYDLIVNTVKDLFGIKSPSRVMMGLGKNISLGLAAGIASGVGDVAGAMALVNGAIQVGGAGFAAGASRFGGGRSAGAPISVTVNAGMGANGTQIGKAIVDEIKKYERANGAVWSAA